MTVIKKEKKDHDLFVYLIVYPGAVLVHSVP